MYKIGYKQKTYSQSKVCAAQCSLKILAEKKKRLTPSFLSRIHVAANKNYCLLCLPQTILYEWTKLGQLLKKIIYSFIFTWNVHE